MQKLFIFLLFIFSILISSVLVYGIFSTKDQGYTIVVNVNNESKILIEDKNITIIYEFIHSSEKTPWIEVWTANKTGFYVRKICWRSGGAGHPSNPEDFNSNVEITIENEYYCAIGVDRFIGREVIVDLGHAVNASITIGNYKIKPPKANVHYIVVLKVLDHRIGYKLYTRSHIYSSTHTILSQRNPHFF